MKKLIKLIILIVVLAVLAFSQNPTITKGRNFVVKEGKTLYQKGVSALSSSKNETVSKIGKNL